MKINLNIEKNYKIILLGIMVIGLGLRLININKSILWHDEAETVINSLQVITDGYPNAYFKNQPIYENGASIKIPINDPIYKYASSNYFGSKYENNKGWFTYYYLAPWLKIFGFSELSARLPFLLFYILTTILIFLFTQKLWANKKISLLACLLFSIDFWAIEYGYRTRYYAPLIFSALSTLYFNYLYITNKKNKYLFLTTSALLLTFHIHIIIFLTLLLFLFYYDFIKNKYLKINKIFIWNALYLLIGTIPWLILVKFWTNFYTHASNATGGLTEIKLIKLLWLLLIAVTYFYYKILIKLAPKFTEEIKKIITKYLPIFILLTIIFVPILIPGESLESRVFICLLPIMSIIVANVLYNLLIISRPQKKYYAFFLLIILFLYYILFFAMNFNYGNYKTDWIEKTIQYAKDNKFQKDDIILTNLQCLSFAVYSEQITYDISVVREDFINNYPHRILAVIYLGEFNDKKSENFKKLNDKNGISLEEYINSIDRIKNCPMFNIQENVVVFDCPSLADKPN